MAVNASSTMTAQKLRIVTSSFRGPAHLSGAAPFQAKETMSQQDISGSCGDFSAGPFRSGPDAFTGPSVKSIGGGQFCVSQLAGERIADMRARRW
jgi:hypothetical protein